MEKAKVSNVKYATESKPFFKALIDLTEKKQVHNENFSQIFQQRFHYSSSKATFPAGKIIK